MSAAVFFAAVTKVNQALAITAKRMDAFAAYKSKYEEYLKKLADRTVGFYTGSTLLKRLQDMLVRQEAARKSGNLSLYFTLNDQILQVAKAIRDWLSLQGIPFDLSQFEAFIRRGGDVNKILPDIQTATDAKSLFPLGTVGDIGGQQSTGKLP
jgi:hypothetical protein